MKFAVVLAVLALALGIEASAIAWGPWGHGHAAALGAGTFDGRSWNGAWGDHGAWDNGHWDDGQWHGDGLWDNGHHGHDDGQWHGDAWSHGGAWAGAGHHAAIIAPAAHIGHAAVIAPAAHAAWGHEGSYVAKTRGAVHVAPLAGHAHSASSINVQPAPGTVY